MMLLNQLFNVTTSDTKLARTGRYAQIYIFLFFLLLEY